MHAHRSYRNHKETAERLLLEMRDRLKDWSLDSREQIVVGGSSAAQDAISALVALGYKPQDAAKAVAQYKGESFSSEELIKRALRESLGKG